MTLLSSLKRPTLLKELSNKTYDLVVIGGGITGAGIALDAASRGMTVALVEKDDFASGTSSRSTKLIHGGLRYLKQFEINLVREVGRERATVHQLAPHLVIAEKMLLPLTEDGTFGKFGTSLGLMVYDFLAGVEDDDKRRMLSKEETLALEPNLREDILKGGGFYAEYRTDDARLTIEIIKTAAKFGAHSINYVKAENFIYDEQQQICGLICRDELTEEPFKIKSKYVVSAAGPWVDQIRKVNKSLSNKHLFLSKGVHIVVPHERLPVNNSLYIDVPDGRMIFTIPRHRVTYIGTTDTPYKEDINHVLTRKEDVEYLLEGVNNMFPEVNLKVEDVVSSWAGLRPLIHEEGKSASELSRKDEIFESKTGLMSIAGGKLTGYRKMAQRIVDLVDKKMTKKYKVELKECHTDKIVLEGGPFKDADEVQKYTSTLEKEIISFGLDAAYAKYLVANYGLQSNAIIEKLKSFNDPIEIALARAETWFCVHHELVIQPMDFFSRRSGRLYFNIDTIQPVMDAVLDDFVQYFDWSKEQRIQMRQEIEQAIYEAANFVYSAKTADG